MDASVGAWTTYDHAPVLSSTCNGSFVGQDTPQSQVWKPPGGLLDDFWRELEQEYPNLVSEFDLSHVPEATQATAGAMTTIVGLPHGTPMSTLLSAPSSSNVSHAMSPPNSTTQPLPMWPATSAPHMPYVPNSRRAGPWTAEQTQRAPYGNLAHDGLRIQIPQPPQHFNIHHGPPLPQMYHQGSPHGSMNQFTNEIPWGSFGQQLFPDDTAWNDDEDEVDAADPCYAQLLWTCLRETPDHTMTLKELYEWIAHHSQKAKDPKNRGWQNSVRHNLSMNAAFERVHPKDAHSAKKGSLWRLTEKSLREGVISTTRYRKDPKRGKSDRKGPAAPKRQLSGMRGGQATRAATRRNREMQHVRSTPYLSTPDNLLRHQQRHDASFISPHSVHSPWQPSQPDMAPSPMNPYFFNFGNESGPPPPASNPHTPPQVQLSYGVEPKGALHDFELRHMDLTNGGLFGDDDEPFPDTPSLGTEASFTDDGMQSLLPQNVHGEVTMF